MSELQQQQQGGAARDVAVASTSTAAAQCQFSYEVQQSRSTNSFICSVVQVLKPPMYRLLSQTPSSRPAVEVAPQFSGGFPSLQHQMCNCTGSGGSIGNHLVACERFTATSAVPAAVSAVSAARVQKLAVCVHQSASSRHVSHQRACGAAAISAPAASAAVVKNAAIGRQGCADIS